MFGMVNRDKFKDGATWFDGQKVSITTNPGLYRGSVYLYNDPSVVVYTRGMLPENWKRVLIPPPPMIVHPINPWNPYPQVMGWNSFDWPEDARYQYAVEGGLEVTSYVNQSFYQAPVGAPFHPMYAHLGR